MCELDDHDDGRRGWGEGKEEEGKKKVTTTTNLEPIIPLVFGKIPKTKS